MNETLGRDRCHLRVEQRSARNWSVTRDGQVLSSYRTKEEATLRRNKLLMAEIDRQCHGHPACDEIASWIDTKSHLPFCPKHFLATRGIKMMVH